MAHFFASTVAAESTEWGKRRLLLSVASSAGLGTLRAMSAAAAFTIRSDSLQTDYHVYVDEASLTAPDIPVLIGMDGDDQFNDLREAAAQLLAENALAPVAIVGLGYGGGYRSPKNRRARDYTPSKWQAEVMESGGAAAFLNFLTSQLLPELQTRLRCNPARAGLAGHSLGSLFALYALCQKAPSFERYLLSSPSLWWDDRSIFKDYRATASTPAPTGTRAYLSIGDSDTPSMTGDIQLFETELAKQPRQNVDYRIQHFPERDHYDVVPDAFYEGLKSLYPRTDGNLLA